MSNENSNGTAVRSRDPYGLQKLKALYSGIGASFGRIDQKLAGLGGARLSDDLLALDRELAVAEENLSKTRSYVRSIALEALSDEIERR